jgi:hypothetical protein
MLWKSAGMEKQLGNNCLALGMEKRFEERNPRVLGDERASQGFGGSLKPQRG